MNRLKISYFTSLGLVVLLAFGSMGCNCKTNTQTEKTINTSDPKAEENVVKLYDFLCHSDSLGIMFGHEDSFSYGIGWNYDDEPGTSDIYKVCGDFPAVFGWDLGHIETGSPVNIDSVNFELMKKMIVKAHEMGGINTVSWHPTHPITGGTTWDTTKAVTYILPGGTHHKKFKGWLTDVGNFFKSLKDKDGKNVPVVFRPYHEHNGSWFWWGDAITSVEEYNQLWKYTVSYLRDTMDIHNLLYAYSPNIVQSKEEYLAKYPGDEWVDLLGVDVYDFPHYGIDYGKVLPQNLEILKSVALEKDKPYALTETGNLCVKPHDWWTESLLKYTKGSGIRWALVWINIEEAQYYGPYPGQVSAENFKAFHDRAETVFLSDLPKIYE